MSNLFVCNDCQTTFDKHEEGGQVRTCPHCNSEDWEILPKLGTKPQTIKEFKGGFLESLDGPAPKFNIIKSAILPLLASALMGYLGGVAIYCHMMGWL